MAKIKSKTLPNGATGDYWSLSRPQGSFKTYIIELWKDENQKKNVVGATPIYSFSFEIPSTVDLSDITIASLGLTDQATLRDASFTAVYNVLTELSIAEYNSNNEFKDEDLAYLHDAVDVL